MCVCVYVYVIVVYMRFYSVESEGVWVKEEGEGGTEESGVLQLTQNTHSQEDGCSLQVQGTAWQVLPDQLYRER